MFYSSSLLHKRARSTNSSVYYHDILKNAASLRKIGESKRGPRDSASFVTRLAFAADIGAYRVDPAGRCLADLARKRGTTASLAAHPRLGAVHELAGNAFDIGVGLHGKARPVARIGAARATCPAIEAIADKPDVSVVSYMWLSDEE
jgi:hypothetical protein